MKQDRGRKLPLLRNWKKWGLLGFCVALTGIMYLKNLGSYLEHARYYEWVTVWNYPYVTVFRREKILEYLIPPYDYLP